MKASDTNNMATCVYDDSSSDSNFSRTSESSNKRRGSEVLRPLKMFKLDKCKKTVNVVDKLFNRQIYGRITKHPKSKTERIFNSIHCQCRYEISDIVLMRDLFNHVFMGFTICGRYFISYKEKVIEDASAMFTSTVEYELFIWRFVAGQDLKFISNHRIFKLNKSSEELDEIMFFQYPSDPHKIVCYGSGLTNPVMAFITILTIPMDSCRHCKGQTRPVDENVSQGWCLNHGFMLHFMFSMAHPTPSFDPNVSLSYPDHLVINTGHYIHILNVSTYEPPNNSTVQGVLESNISNSDEKNLPFAFLESTNSENLVENLSLQSNENGDTNSVVEAILEDFSEYDLEGTDCNKPFHELNISCEPLNVTGKSYHNTLVQNIVDPRLKRLQQKDGSIFSSSGQKLEKEKSKIDKKTAEKAYEFTEENEKCEKLSSFRKKRLADKKYEFSEDNTENIVPYHTLRRERRYLYRSQGRCIRSPDYSTFLSPRSSSGVRSPMQSPNSWNSQFSPGSVRHLYCPVLKSSPHHSKSPISPRDSARKFNVYSPSLDSDCSDYDSKLILRHVNNISTSIPHDQRIHLGLLIVDSKKDESSKWIKKLVKRYSSADFETSSLVSGQSRDENNIPIEIPLIVQTLMDQHLDVLPDYKMDQTSETQLIITQRTFDCEQFVQRRAQKLCADSQLEFLHCEDYDIKLQHICPINGHIICQAVIKIGALKLSEPNPKPNVYVSNCLFTWNIISDAFEVIEPSEPQIHLQATTSQVKMLDLDIPQINRKEVLVMDYNSNMSKACLRDYNNYFEITLENKDFYNFNTIQNMNYGYSTATDNDSN